MDTIHILNGKKMTYSIAARAQETNEYGVCTSTGASPSVGSVVPHVKEGVGAIATQASTNIRYGIDGLKLLRLGFSASNSLQIMLNEDPKRELRQVVIIDNSGHVAAHTGKDIIGTKNQIVGDNYVAAGNSLARIEVIEEMVNAFRTKKGKLANRLLSAVEAGESAGGDIKGKRSAALIVKRIPPYSQLRPYIDVRVDDHHDPVIELRRIYESFEVALDEIRAKEI